MFDHNKLVRYFATMENSNLFISSSFFQELIKKLPWVAVSKEKVLEVVYFSFDQLVIKENYLCFMQKA